MRRVVIFAVLMAIVLSEAAFAAMPKTISYQGVLRQGDWVLVPDGGYWLTFKLYNAPAAGVALWTETDSVYVQRGVFNTILGDQATLTLAFNQKYWLGTSVGANPELAPRVELTASPYAIRAAVADSVVGGVNIGDITAIYADAGLTGGATSGDAHVSVGAGDGIDVMADQVSVDVTDFAGNGLGEEATNDLRVNTGVGLQVSGDAVGLDAAYSSGSAYDARFVNEGQANSVSTGMVVPNIVSSVDGVVNDGGDIDLVAGGNITITPDDVNNRITISATGGGNIGGGGTANYVAKFTDPTTIGNSLMWESGSTVIVGTGAKDGEEVVKPGDESSRGDRQPYKMYVSDNNGQTLYGKLIETDAASDHRAGVYGYRTRYTQNNGSGYGYNQTNNAITGYNFFGDQYTFGVAGYCYNDYTLTGGVIGANHLADYWGALGYKDANSAGWGVYTPNNAYVGGTLRMPSGAAANEVLKCDASGNASWLPETGDIEGVTAGTGLTGGGTSGAVTLNVADPLNWGNTTWDLDFNYGYFDLDFSDGRVDITRTNGYPAVNIQNNSTPGDGDCLACYCTSTTAGTSTWLIRGSTYHGYGAYITKNTDDNVYTVYISSPSSTSEGLYVYGNTVATGTKSAAIRTSQGWEAVFSVESPEVEIFASGEARLTGGSASVAFDRLFTESISPGVEVRVTATPVGGWSGLYIVSTNREGFEVASGAGDPNVDFHWMACGRRIGYETRPQVTIPDPDGQKRLEAEKDRAIATR